MTTILKHLFLYVITSVFLTIAALTGHSVAKTDQQAAQSSQNKAQTHKAQVEKKKTKRRSYKRKKRVVKKKAIKKSARKGLRRYIEFRSRPNGAMDHSYIAYGYLNRRGKPYKTKYIGLHPKGGTAGMLIGIVAMEARLDPLPEDKTATPIVSYRVPLTRKEYNLLLKTIAAARKDKDSWGVWNPVLNNCNSFVGYIARAIGIKVPNTSVMGPTSYVKALRDMNENENYGKEMAQVQGGT